MKRLSAIIAIIAALLMTSRSQAVMQGCTGSDAEVRMIQLIEDEKFIQAREIAEKILNDRQHIICGQLRDGRNHQKAFAAPINASMSEINSLDGTNIKNDEMRESIKDLLFEKKPAK